MKVEVVQTACPAATGNYDITGVTPASDMIGALFFTSVAVTNDLNSGNLRYCFGATDLTNNLCLTMGGFTAVGAGIRSSLSTTRCLESATGAPGGTTGPVASFNSALSTGVRLTTTSVTTGRLLNTLLISGIDTAMKVGAVQFGSLDLTKVITHGLGGTPDVIIFLTSMGQNLTDTDGTGIAVGFWDRATGNMSSSSYCATTGANPTDNTAQIGAGTMGEILAPGVDNAHITVATVTSTQFTINLSAALDATNKMVGWIALRGLTAQMFSANAVATLPTATGNSPLITGMSGRPQCYLALPTRMTAQNSPSQSDSAGGFGVSLAATPDFVTTYQGSVADTFQWNVATSLARHQISNVHGMLELLNTGAADTLGTLSTWDAAGVTINYSAAAAGAFLTPVLAFGMPLVIPLPSYPASRTQFFSEDRVSFY